MNKLQKVKEALEPFAKVGSIIRQKGSECGLWRQTDSQGEDIVITARDCVKAKEALAELNSVRDSGGYRPISEAPKEMKPCPFCGKTTVSVYGMGDEEHWIADCMSCEANIDYCKSEEQAIELWNRRAD